MDVQLFGFIDFGIHHVQTTRSRGLSYRQALRTLKLSDKNCSYSKVPKARADSASDCLT